MFFGLHERQLDDKGRVALPPVFRNELGEACYLVVGDSRCVDVYGKDEFETNARDIVARVRRGEDTMTKQRALGHSATLVTIDKQGRVTVDERLRDFARIPLSSTVVVAGNIDRVELWSEAVHREISELNHREMARGADATGAP